VPDIDYVQAIKVITLPDDRMRRCYIKTVCLLSYVLLKQQDIDEGVQEAILVRDGKVTESSAANVFIVKDGVIKTPPKSDLILPGITRDLIVELADQGKLDCREQDITEQELREADEVWVSSSTREIAPVTELDGKPVGTGEVGSVWYNTMQLFLQYKSSITGQHYH